MLLLLKIKDVILSSLEGHNHFGSVAAMRPQSVFILGLVAKILTNFPTNLCLQLVAHIVILLSGMKTMDSNQIADWMAGEMVSFHVRQCSVAV